MVLFGTLRHQLGTRVHSYAREVLHWLVRVFRLATDSSSRVIRSVAHNHQLVSRDREQGIAQAIRSGELHLESAAIIHHDDGANLTPMQHEWLTTFGVPHGHIVEQCDEFLL